MPVPHKGYRVRKRRPEALTCSTVPISPQRVPRHCDAHVNVQNGAFEIQRDSEDTDAPREKSLLQGTWGSLILGGSNFGQPTDSPRAFLLTCP